MNEKETYRHINRNKTDYSVVRSPARIAVYDNLKSPPRIIVVKPALTDDFIENLTTSVYDEVIKRQSNIPYTVIREISENFIHAGFTEIVVSVLDNGKTIRFSDQGPGFSDINNAQLPGFTSATEAMKKYIRGVGSGLPTVKDYLKYSDGYIKIENNLQNGAVVTISTVENLKNSVAFSDTDQEKSEIKHVEKMNKLSPALTQREKGILMLLFREGALGISEISKLSNVPLSSVHKLLSSLQESGLIEQIPNKKRILTDQGFAVVQVL